LTWDDFENLIPGSISPLLECLSGSWSSFACTTVTSMTYLGHALLFLAAIPRRCVWEKTILLTEALSTHCLQPPSIFERTLFWRYFHRHQWMLDKLWEAAQSYGEEVSRLEKLAEESPSRALLITPDRMPPAKFITRDRAKINRTVDMGYRKAARMIEVIRSFVEH